MADPVTFDLPFKLRVLYALTDALKSITPTAGYAFDMSSTVDPEDPTALLPRVFRGRAWFGDGDPLPMLSVLEGASPADEVVEAPRDAVTGEYDWVLRVQGFVEDDPVHPTDPAYLLQADVRRRLAEELTRKLESNSNQPDVLGIGHGKNRITKMKIGPGVVRPADEVSSKAYFWVTIILRITDNASLPFQ